MQDAGVDPLAMTDVIDMLRDMVPLLAKENVLKFDAQRSLKNMTEAENKAVSTRSLWSPPAHQLYNLLHKLAGNSCWQIIGTQVREDGQRRNTAQALQKSNAIKDATTEIDKCISSGLEGATPEDAVVPSEL